MKHIENYNKLFEENNIEAFLYALEDTENGDHYYKYPEMYNKYGALFIDDEHAKNFDVLKFLAYDKGSKSSVFFFNDIWEHDTSIEYLEALCGEKISNIFDKKLIEGFFENRGGIPTLVGRGLLKKDSLDVIVNTLFNIKTFSKLYNKKSLVISTGYHRTNEVDVAIEIPYKDYNYKETDTTLSLFYKIISMYKDDKILLKDFDIVSAVSPLPNDIQSKVIDKFNRMFKKSPNMKIKVLPKGMSQAEYNHKKTRYKFTESKDNEL